MWVSKKKLKEIEDKYEVRLEKHMRILDGWCTEEATKANASRARTDEWQAKAEQFNREHHALVEKFLATMVECLKK